MSRLVALDPGRSKCGLVLIDCEHNRVLAGAVVPPEAVMAWVKHWHEQHGFDQIIVGDGTGGTQWIHAFNGLAHVQSVNERGTTLRARQRYWEFWPPRGWQRLLPRGLRLPPNELDAIAALVMAEDHLKQRCSWLGPPPNLSLKTWPEP
ncbi:resolvase [Synechococcus sp. AH-551-E05]|nr:resolvase [Synechococcus sp. AH-551-E05]MDB4651184.1 resolvase [Synechococcus sp. AH-551-E05]